MHVNIALDENLDPSEMWKLRIGGFKFHDWSESVQASLNLPPNKHCYKCFTDHCRFKLQFSWFQPKKCGLKEEFWGVGSTTKYQQMYDTEDYTSFFKKVQPELTY